MQRATFAAGRLTPLLVLCLAFTPTLAQEPGPEQQSALQQHTDSALDLLAQLDTLAATCLTSLDQDAPDNSATRSGSEPCADFLAAVDGKLLRDYLAHCQTLTQWRDEYVGQAYESSAADTAGEGVFRLLIGVEYACSGSALQQRTHSVTTAFNLLQGRDRTAQRETLVLTQRLAEQRFDAALNRERQLLQDSVEQQQRRQELETERQRVQRELELVRQQRALPAQ